MEDLYFQTLIDTELWDSAQWRATAFLHDPSGAEPPCLGLVFEDMDAGKRIFSNWIRRLGRVDRYEELRLSIVEGDILGLDSGYSVHISSDPIHSAQRARSDGLQIDFDTAILVSRFHRMTPTPGASNLTQFKWEFGKHQRYFLVPVSSDGTPHLQNSITKTEIHLRNASDVAAGDVDSVIFPAHYFDGDGNIN